jgi:hypothetical protein
MTPDIPPAQARMVGDADDDIVPLSFAVGSLVYFSTRVTLVTG